MLKLSIVIIFIKSVCHNVSILYRSYTKLYWGPKSNYNSSFCFSGSNIVYRFLTFPLFLSLNFRRVIICNDNVT